MTLYIFMNYEVQFLRVALFLIKGQTAVIILVITKYKKINLAQSIAGFSKPNPQQIKYDML